METSATIAHDDRAELLASAPLLAGVDDDGIKAIARRVVEVEFPKDHVIARQGEVGTGFFLVAKGRVRVVRDGETIAHIGPGDFFGEIALLDGGPRTATAIAETPCRLLAIEPAAFNQMLDDPPSVNKAVLQSVGQYLRNIDNEGAI